MTQGIITKPEFWQKPDDSHPWLHRSICYPFREKIRLSSENREKATQVHPLYPVHFLQSQSTCQLLCIHLTIYGQLMLKKKSWFSETKSVCCVHFCTVHSDKNYLVYPIQRELQIEVIGWRKREGEREEEGGKEKEWRRRWGGWGGKGHAQTQSWHLHSWKRLIKMDSYFVGVVSYLLNQYFYLKQHRDAHHTDI